VTAQPAPDDAAARLADDPLTALCVLYWNVTDGSARFLPDPTILRRAKRAIDAALAPLTPPECPDPEHPDGAYCVNTTGLGTCYSPEAPAPLPLDVERLQRALETWDEDGSTRAIWSEAVPYIAALYRATPEPTEDCALCARAERVLGADQSEGWVAEFWAAWTEHPHAPTEDGQP
jgi:hypothetical protein